MTTAILSTADSWVVLPANDGYSPDFLSRVEVDVAQGSPSFVGTLTLQKRLAVGETDSDYRDIATFTTVDNQVLDVHRRVWQVRLGFKAGAYTSGQARVGLT